MTHQTWSYAWKQDRSAASQWLASNVAEFKKVDYSFIDPAREGYMCCVVGQKDHDVLSRGITIVGSL